jgi:hypothetical protein
MAFNSDGDEIATRRSALADFDPQLDLSKVPLKENGM